MSIILIALGGGSGAVARFLIIKFFRAYLPNLMIVPWDIMTINMLGSFGIGLCGGLLYSKGISLEIRQFVTIGFLGGFTTFSSFTEGGYVLADKSGLLAIFYLATSVFVGILACYFGHYISFKLVN